MCIFKELRAQLLDHMVRVCLFLKEIVKLSFKEAFPPLMKEEALVLHILPSIGHSQYSTLEQTLESIQAFCYCFHLYFAQ